MRRARRYGLGLTPVLAALVLSRVLVPAAPLTMTPWASPPLWTGAYHIHTTRSDGSGTPADVAEAAAAAGLDFVILTDHGDGTRDPLPPAYLSGVLVIDGVEVSTADGHYVAIGMPAAPYPLGGEGRDVAEDVRRLGGIGILAHPDSARDALAWHDADTHGDGLEVLNADSAWRDESMWSLLWRLLPYPWRPSAVLATTLTYPDALLARLDTPDADAPRLALAGVDAHARVGLRPGEEPMDSARTLARMPSYATSFGTFGLVMPWEASTQPSGRPAEDAQAVIEALRRGSVHVAVFALADAAPMRFSASTSRGTFDAGASIPAGDPVRLSVEVPDVPEVTLRVLRNGRPWQSSVEGGSLQVDVAAGDPPAVYRAEAWLPRRWQQPVLPWMVSQAIAVGVAAQPGRPSRLEGSRDGGAGSAGTLLTGAWHVEHDARSSATITQESPTRIVVETRLGGGSRMSQFAAAVVDWPSQAAAWSISFVGSASRPMRVAVQVREPGAGDGRRWVRSVYLAPEPRRIVVALDDMRAVPPASGAPPVDRLHALLLVVDTVNSPPGVAAHFTIDDLRLH